MIRWLVVLMGAFMTAGCAAARLDQPGREPAAFLKVPPGFQAEILVANVPNARSMTLGDKGTLFVGTRSGGTVYAVRDVFGASPVVQKFAEGLSMPNGVAFHDGALYVAEQKRIVRYPAAEERRDGPRLPEVVDPALPYKGVLHSWKYLAFGPDNKLYVPVGAPCNVCVEPGFGVILRMNADGSGREVVATGIRNSVGFDWQPGTGELWFTDNGRDMLGDDVPPCELNRVQRPGLDFGFPYCHAGDIADPQFGAAGRCSDSVAPVQKLGPHVAPLAVKFYTGSMFPGEYRNQALIAEHGSWNRSKEAGKTGYRITLVRLKGDTAVSYEPFIEGWLNGDEVLGRPVDLLVAPDGSLLVSDDQRGVIYRISYQR
ncbi:MAG: PQQ-dependent sugar dehydrogenase [Gammaproteobacteria bacterium]